MSKTNKILMLSTAILIIVFFTVIIIVNSVRQIKYKKMIEEARTSPEKFILTFAPVFKKVCKGTPLFTSVKLAQAALETGWGKNFVNGANNMFGIKATGKINRYWKGDKMLAGTREVYSGKNHNISDYFRKYDCLEDSIRDHSNLLLTESRYEAVRKAKTPEEQCKMIHACGYATDPRYANSLIKIINDYNLKQFD